MKKSSVWAWHNRGKARMLVVLLNISLVALGVWLGSSLYSLQILFPPWVLALAVLLFLLTIGYYPSGKRIRFRRRKYCDLLLAASSFLMICCLANRDNLPGMAPILSGHGAVIDWSGPGKPAPTAEDILRSVREGKQHLTRAEKRILKKELRRQIKTYIRAKASGDKKSAGKAVAIILSIFLAIGLIYGLAALACSISCGGSPGLAIFVFIVGLTGIIFGLVMLIRSIQRGPVPRHPRQQPNSSSSAP